jgi:hypothetical protein
MSYQCIADFNCDCIYLSKKMTLKSMSKIVFHNSNEIQEKILTNFDYKLSSILYYNNKFVRKLIYFTIITGFIQNYINIWCKA